MMRLTWLGLIWWSSLALGTPIVIFDSGNTQDATWFYPSSDSSTAIDLDWVRYDLFDAIYPIKTPNLTIGQPIIKRTNLPLTHSLCLIGSDAQSSKWLTQNAQYLQKIDAICLVVNVQTPVELQALQMRSPNLKLLPVSANDIVDKLGINSYPALLIKQ